MWTSSPTRFLREMLGSSMPPFSFSPTRNSWAWRGSSCANNQHLKKGAGCDSEIAISRFLSAISMRKVEKWACAACSSQSIVWRSYNSSWVMDIIKLHKIYTVFNYVQWWIFIHSLEKIELQTLLPCLTTLLNMCVIYSSLVSFFNELINKVKKAVT